MFALEPCLYGSTIIIPIAVLPPSPGGTKPRLARPPFIVPAGRWTLVWNLVTIPARLPAASFAAENGIELPATASVTFSSSVRISSTQWSASAVTSAEADMSAADYIINFYPPGDPGNGAPLTSSDREVMSHDPTVVIAHDPIEPPS